MLIDDIHTSVTPLGEETLFEGIIEVLLRLIGIRLNGPSGVGDGNTEEAARLKDPQGFLQKPAHFVWVGEVFEKMFAVDLRGRVVGKREGFPQIELQIGISMEEIDVDPSWLGVGSAAKLNSEGRLHMHRPDAAKSPKVLSLDLSFDANIPNGCTESARGM
jgi:hypothetical protein